MNPIIQTIFSLGGREQFRSRVVVVGNWWPWRGVGTMSWEIGRFGVSRRQMNGHHIWKEPNKQRPKDRSWKIRRSLSDGQGEKETIRVRRRMCGVWGMDRMRLWGQWKQRGKTYTFPIMVSALGMARTVSSYWHTHWPCELGLLVNSLRSQMQSRPSGLPFLSLLNKQGTPTSATSPFFSPHFLV